MLKVLHPFMPFITEEIWHYLRENKDPKDALIVASWPELEKSDSALLEEFEKVQDVVGNIRNVRKQKNIPNKNELELKVKLNNKLKGNYDSVVAHLCNISSIEQVDEKIENAFSFISNGNEYFIPFSEEIDVEAEKKKIEEDLNYTKGFLKSVEKKLSNERFVNNAPEQVVASEKKKQSDAEAKIKILEEKLTSLG